MLPGDHGCFVHAAASDRREVLRAYVRALAASQRVAYVCGEHPEVTEDWLCAGDPLMRRGTGSGQLLLLGAGGAARGHRSADPSRTLECLQLVADEAAIDGYRAVRLAVEGRCLTEGLAPGRVVAFESDLTRLVEANRMLALCVYPAAPLPERFLLPAVVAGHAQRYSGGDERRGAGRWTRTKDRAKGGSRPSMLPRRWRRGPRRGPATLRHDVDRPPRTGWVTSQPHGRWTDRRGPRRLG